MKKSIYYKIILILIVFIGTANSMNLIANKKNILEEISMFPKAEQDYKQVYVKVPKKHNEENFKIELFVGKNELLDCNSYFLLGGIEEKTLEGWGYNYYIVSSNGEVAGTLMACPDNKKTMKFVYIKPLLLRYNSKLPIVVYLPKNLELRYRIWQADKKMKNAKQINFEK